MIRGKGEGVVRPTRGAGLWQGRGDGLEQHERLSREGAGAGPSGLGAFGYAREGSTTVVPWAMGTVLGRRAEPRGGRSRGWREGQDKPVPWDTQCEAAPPERERCERLFRTIPKIGHVPGAFTPRRPAPGTRRRSNDAAPSSVPVRM